MIFIEKFKSLLKNKRNFLNDVSLNIIASLLLTIVTQIVAYPIISRMLTIEDYGNFLLIMGVIYATGVSLGNSLNNTRLLMQSQYEENKVVGDYNTIFIISLILNALLVLCCLILIEEKSYILNAGYIMISILVMFRAYYTVSYRIKINYKKTLNVSIVGVIGYLFGLVVTYYTQLWIFTFICGELTACIYIYITSGLVKEKSLITNLFVLTIKKYMSLLIAAVFAVIITYMDRFFIYPILGAEEVAVYNVASSLGKIGAVVILPISGVLLTYYSKESVLTISQFLKRMIWFIGLIILLLVGLELFGPSVLEILYPSIYSQSLPYFYLTNLGVAVLILGSVIQPVTLRYSKAMWQPIIQGGYLLLYFFIGTVLMKNNGLMGFCLSLLIVNSVRFISFFLLSIYSIKKLNNR